VYAFALNEPKKIRAQMVRASRSMTTTSLVCLDTFSDRKKMASFLCQSLLRQQGRHLDDQPAGLPTKLLGKTTRDESSTQGKIVLLQDRGFSSPPSFPRTPDQDWGISSNGISAALTKTRFTPHTSNEQGSSQRKLKMDGMRDISPTPPPPPENRFDQQQVHP